MKAIPVLDKAVREFVIWFSEQQRQWFYDSVARGVVDAIEKRDQRNLEHTIGSPRAGKPSGHPGVEYETDP